MQQGVEALEHAQYSSEVKLSHIQFIFKYKSNKLSIIYLGYYETIGPMKESAVWVEEAPLQSLVWGRRSLSPSGFQQQDPLGLSVEAAR